MMQLRHSAAKQINKHLKNKVLIMAAVSHTKGFLGRKVVKNWPGDARDIGSIPGLGKIPLEEGNENPIQYSCL